ncbi:MAG: TonB-dependent receptor plug domain-containing protein, partial [Gemmatimonadota bacterium]
MHRRKLSHVLTLALVAATAATQRPARAQEIPDRVYRLGEVVVSGRRDAGVESIGTVRTITAAEIQASGARSLDEAIALVPGLLVRIGGAGTPRIDFRGFRTRHVQLLLDGIPINDTYDAQFDPTTIPVEFIERIKVTTGGGSLLYGPSGNGGVINIITRRGAEELEGAVSMGTREGSAYQGDLTVSGAAGAWRLLGSAETYSRDSYPLSGDFRATAEENGGARANSDARRQSLFASARYAASERT